jgi:hypothetical protein
VWLKSPSLHQTLPLHSLEREWMAAKLAADLGIRSAQALQVRLTREFLSSIDDDDLRLALSQGPEVVLGSVDAGEGWGLLDPNRKLPWSHLPASIRIVAFDSLIQNSDRMSSNPNMLRHGDELMLIDNEEAFSRAVTNEGSVPWKPMGLFTFAQGNMQHVLVPLLAPKSRCNFHDVAEDWKSLDERAIRRYGEQASAEWCGPTMDRISDYICDARTNVDTFCDLANELLAT